MEEIQGGEERQQELRALRERLNDKRESTGLSFIVALSVIVVSLFSLIVVVDSPEGPSSQAARDGVRALCGLSALLGFAWAGFKLRQMMIFRRRALELERLLKP